jgi:hypothetical protein
LCFLFPATKSLSQLHDPAQLEAANNRSKQEMQDLRIWNFGGGNSSGCLRVQPEEEEIHTLVVVDLGMAVIKTTSDPLSMHAYCTTLLPSK